MIRKLDFTTKEYEKESIRLLQAIEKTLLASFPYSLVIDGNESYFVENLYPDFDDFRASLDGQSINQIITERVDPFYEYTTLLALRRTMRPQPNEKEDNFVKTQDCIFDDLQKVSHPLVAIDGGEAYATPNPYAFNSGDHEVIFTREHIEFLKDIQERHIKVILQGLVERGEFMLQHPHVNQLSAGVNFGTAKMKHSAGASIPHLHAQIGAVYTTSYLPMSDKMFAVMHTYADKGIDYIKVYLENIKENDCYIKESKYFIAFTPFAPRFKDEVHIIAKDNTIQSLVDLRSEALDDLANLLYTMLHALHGIGVESFNMAIIGRRLGNGEDTSRFLLKIMPRESDIAYSELLDRYVVDRFPEKTAQILREELAL